MKDLRKIAKKNNIPYIQEQSIIKQTSSSEMREIESAVEFYVGDSMSYMEEVIEDISRTGKLYGLRQPYDNMIISMDTGDNKDLITVIHLKKITEETPLISRSETDVNDILVKLGANQNISNNHVDIFKKDSFRMRTYQIIVDKRGGMSLDIVPFDALINYNSEISWMTVGSASLLNYYMENGSREYVSSSRVYVLVNIGYVRHILMLFQCKNITYKKMGPEMSEVSRKRERLNGRYASYEYYVLRINTGDESGSAHSSSSLDDEKKIRFHLCRGHFAEYTEEKKLFGKYVGRYWIPAHVRGNPELGTIEKDYEVKHADFDH
jgi:hypothetical protein